MSNETPLGPGGEFDAIRSLLERWGPAASGIGDDAAVLDVPRGERIVVSTDASVESRHFLGGWLTPEEIAYRAVTAALSDLAAMAARPMAILWAVNLPEMWRSALPELADGVRAAARAAHARIVGGNITAAHEMSLTTTVIGSVYEPLMRRGARPGDQVYVTGRLGGPMLALDALIAGRRPEPAHRERFARPVARIAPARWLADRGATAGLDISDGLTGDAAHLAAASAVQLTIDVERIPAMAGADMLTAAMSGEEYELLVAAPSLDTAEFERAFSIPLTAIGEVRAGAGAIFRQEGRPITLGRGHDHLSR